MCEFLSFNVDRQGNIYFLKGEERVKAKLQGENPDSHSFISEYFQLNDDEVWKYELELPTNIEELQKIDMNNIMNYLKYDGGLPEEEIPYSVVKKIEAFVKNLTKDDLVSLLNQTYLNLEDFIYTKEENTILYTLPSEIQGEVLYRHIVNNYAYKQVHMHHFQTKGEPNRFIILTSLYKHKDKIVKQVLFNIYKHQHKYIDKSTLEEKIHEQYRVVVIPILEVK